MDLFPAVLTNRDMDTLMRIIEEHGDEVLLSQIQRFEKSESIDEVKAEVAQMDSREMSFFLPEFGQLLSVRLREGGPIVSVPEERGFVLDQRQLEAQQSIRKAIAALYGIKGRIRRPRG